jgi:phosphoadenosine phosphosulfate reductase
MRDLQELINKLENKSAIEQLKILSNEFEGKIVFSTSFQLEDQVITDMIFDNNINIEIFTLDTGRLFEETYKTFNKTIKRYKKNIKVYYPDAKDVEKLLTEKGPFSFYESVENRKECCNIRKVKPLQRALNNKLCWVTGLRAGQSDTRKDVPVVDWDEKYQLVKFNPLINWTLEQVRDYITQNNVPYNVMQDKGFPSIGCAPCTRAIEEGEDIRAGRWWWENNLKKECGLHVKE